MPESAFKDGGIAACEEGAKALRLFAQAIREPNDPEYGLVALMDMPAIFGESAAGATDFLASGLDQVADEIRRRENDSPSHFRARS